MTFNFLSLRFSYCYLLSVTTIIQLQSLQVNFSTALSCCPRPISSIDFSLQNFVLKICYFLNLGLSNFWGLKSWLEVACTLWQSILLVEEIIILVPWENHNLLHVINNRLSHKVVLNTICQGPESTHNFIVKGIDFIGRCKTNFLDPFSL